MRYFKSLLFFSLSAVLVCSQYDNPPLVDWENIDTFQTTTKRQNINTHTILAIGGYGLSNNAGTIEVYNPVNDSWSFFAETELNITRFSTAVLHGKLFIFGGMIFDRFSKLTTTNEVWSFDLKSKKLTDLPPMHNRRSCTKAAVLFGLIYICGGCNRHHISMDTIERFNPKTNKWAYRPRMPKKRKLHAVASWKGKLYVAGGQDENYNMPRTLDIYDPKMNRWTSTTSMIFLRLSFNIIPMPEGLFAIGGGPAWYKQIPNERLNFKTQKWRSIVDPPKRFGDSSAVALGGKIIVTNGYNETYEYNPKNMQWKTLQSRNVSRLYPNMLLVPKTLVL